MTLREWSAKTGILPTTVTDKGYTSLTVDARNPHYKELWHLSDWRVSSSVAAVVWLVPVVWVVPIKRRVTKLTFEIITTEEWDEKSIEEIGATFAKLFGGDLNIASACLVNVEVVDAPVEE